MRRFQCSADFERPGSHPGRSATYRARRVQRSSENDLDDETIRRGFGCTVHEPPPSREEGESRTQSRRESFQQPGRAAGSRWGLGSGLLGTREGEDWSRRASRSLNSPRPVHLRYATHTKLAHDTTFRSILQRLPDHGASTFSLTVEARELVYRASGVTINTCISELQPL